MHLSEINIYPVKSLMGISLGEARVENRGLQFDRSWMLVDENNKFLTQREFPKMATVNVAVDKESLTAAADGSSIVIPLIPEPEDTASVKIWTSSVKGRVYSAEVNDWFSEAIGTECRLVLMPEETKRKVNPFYAVRKFKDTVSFADGYPFLLIGESSLDDLNSRLDAPLPMNRFRPNFVVAGSEPFAEDIWKKIRIGETVFHLVKPCARCVITTVDQSIGEMDGKEPLKTLAAYRNKGGNVMFGQNLIAEAGGGIVNAGDEVHILQ
ncbi:MAG: MOSC domain-containing protein [Saprospiraceae bacterium]|nr:MOSC domain-containing protein [Pyrinomonadaceae bacterium]